MNKDRIRMVRQFVNAPRNPDAAKERFAAIHAYITEHGLMAGGERGPETPTSWPKGLIGKE